MGPRSLICIVPIAMLGKISLQKRSVRWHEGLSSAILQCSWGLELWGYVPTWMPDAFQLYGWFRCQRQVALRRPRAGANALSPQGPVPSRPIFLPGLKQQRPFPDLCRHRRRCPRANEEVNYKSRVNFKLHWRHGQENQYVPRRERAAQAGGEE